MDTAEIVAGDETTYEVISAAFEVYNHLGGGFLEQVYEKALVHEITARGLEAVSQKQIAVYYKGVEVGSYYPDILVNGALVVELKSTEQLAKSHHAQLLNYLKATGMKKGLLLNFGRDRVEVKRFAF